MNTYEIERVPMMVPVKRNAAYSDVYSGTGGTAYFILLGQLIRAVGGSHKTVIIFMHPTAALHALQFPPAVAASGIDVICANSRYAGNDSALIMENVLIDIGAFIRAARDQYGYQNVILGGWSGGGSLMCYYQSQAESPTVKATPAGDPFDMREAGLLSGDAVIVIAAHRCRHRTLADWIDGSVVNESDPTKRNRELDLYDQSNPNKPPYTKDFIQAYRQAQLHRVRKITTWVKSLLGELKRNPTEEVERGFVVHRTMADLKWLDPAVDPNDRVPGICYQGDPKVVNTSPAGFARFCSLRSWLSQWSYDDALGDGPTNLKYVTVPFMIIENTADEACPRADTQAFFDAAPRPDKEIFINKGATHYFAGQPEHLKRAINKVQDWLAQKQLI
jgi:pimeloyl-ACP methyl ester carboxylesterase